MRLDFKMPSGLGFFSLPAKSPGSRLLVAIGIKWHCKKLVISFISGGLRIFPPYFSFIRFTLEMPHKACS